MWAFAHSSWLRQWTAVRSRPRWGQRACRWASRRRFLTVCAEILWLCKQIIAAAVRVAGLRWSWRWKMLVLGWCDYTWSGVVKPVGCTAKFSETPLEMAYGREMNIQFPATAMVDIPAVSMPIARSFKTSVALCCVIKLHILEWPFIVASLRHTCAIIILSNQHLDMPHLWGGWIITAKEKCSLTQICE